MRSGKQKASDSAPIAPLLPLLYAVMVALPLPACGKPEQVETTWIEVGGMVFGCVPDSTGPVGGGDGYMLAVAGGDYEAASVGQLIKSLREAGPGQTVFIPGETELDFTELALNEDFALRVPAGVTLAGNRGTYGSAGALLKSDAFQTSPLIRIDGRGARITGLRIRGPDPERNLKHWWKSFLSSKQQRDGLAEHEYYYLFPTSRGVSTEFDDLQVDNCELSGWSQAAVSLANGWGHHIHHNYIHHNQRQGLGYGISHGTAFSIIEYNLFGWNRHSIAGGGRPPSGYIARYNVETGHSLSHNFDMHGGRDRKDGTTSAGTRIEIYNNTFLGKGRAVRIRGRPLEYARIYDNWFASHQEPGPAVILGPVSGTIELGPNLFGRSTPTVR